MSNTMKLYKCYKGTCGKCLDEENPYITEDEYKDLLDADGKIQCPEGHLECGIQELRTEDLPKPPTDNKKRLKVFGGIALLILLLGGGGYAYYWYSKVKTTVDTVKTTIEIGTDVVEKIKESKQQPAVPVDTSSQTKDTSKLITPPSQPEPPKPERNKDDKGSVDVPPTPTMPCQQQHPSFDKFFGILTDKSISSDCKSDMIKKDYLKYFTSDAQIENVHNGDCEGQAQDISGFLTTYINSGYHIYPQNCNTDIKPGGRYKLLHVQVIRAK